VLESKAKGQVEAGDQVRQAAPVRIQARTTLAMNDKSGEHSLTFHFTWVGNPSLPGCADRENQPTNELSIQ
jgi:hypothetical protein